MAMDNGPHIQDVLLQFRAGRMLLEGTRVVPDARKGLVQITRDVEGLVHLQWLDRSRGIVTTVEDDHIIFPDEATFEKVNQSPDRVYILKFNSDSRKLFFWMQEPDADGDAGICTAVNVYINQPLGFAGEDEPEASIPLPVSERSEDTAEDEMSSRAGNLHDGNLASELASEATSALPPPFLSLSDQQRTLRMKLASEATSDRPLSSSEVQQRDLARMTSPLVGEAASSLPVQLSDLQRILRSIQPGGTIEDPDGGLGLADILKPDLILPLIETLGLEQQLASFLPEGSQTREDLIELLQSPPFRQQVDTFTHVLRTGQVDLSQFGVDPSKYKFTVLSFLEALNDSVTKAAESGEEAGSAGSPSQRCPNDDAMDES